MEFGSLSPTVDVFELVLAVLLVLVGLPAVVYNLRESWAEKEWALDDPDPAIRRLGINRYDNARLLFLAVVLIALGTLSSLLVPSVLQLSGAPVLDIQDVLNSVLQRVVFIGVVLCITYKAVNDAVWRRDVDRRRRRGSGVGTATLAAPGAGGISEVRVPVVEAPAVVVSPGEPGAPPPGAGKD